MDNKENINCNVGYRKEAYLRPPHGATPTAVIENETKSSFQTSDNINEKEVN